MSVVPVWTCEFAEAPGGPKLDQLTVGAKFRLNCKGDIAVAWTKDPLRVKFPKDDQAYALHVLNAENLASQGAQLTVTAYRAGEMTPEYVRVLQGDHGFEIEKPKWKVGSVLKPDSKPYGSLGPWGTSLPVWIWGAVALLGLLVITFVVMQLRRVLARRRLREELKRHRTALTPAHQFYRDARGLRRRLDLATDAAEMRDVAQRLNREFRMYWLRHFEVPALDWSDGELRRDVQRRHPAVERAAGEALAKTLRELSRLTSKPAVLKADVEQLLAMCLGAAEAVERVSLSGRTK